MAAVTLRLARLIFLPDWPSANVDWASVLIALVGMAAAFRWKARPAWIVVGGAMVGVVLSLLG